MTTSYRVSVDGYPAHLRAIRSELHGRSLIDTACGVIMSRTGMDPTSAGADLIDTARDHGLDVFALARAVLELCTHTSRAATRAAQVADARWGTIGG